MDTHLTDSLRLQTATTLPSPCNVALSNGVLYTSAVAWTKFTRLTPPGAKLKEEGEQEISKLAKRYKG